MSSVVAKICVESYAKSPRQSIRCCVLTAIDLVNLSLVVAGAAITIIFVDLGGLPETAYTSCIHGSLFRQLLL